MEGECQVVKQVRPYVSPPHGHCVGQWRSRGSSDLAQGGNGATTNASKEARARSEWYLHPEVEQILASSRESQLHVCLKGCEEYAPESQGSFAPPLERQRASMPTIRSRVGELPSNPQSPNQAFRWPRASPSPTAPAAGRSQQGPLICIET